MNAAYLVAGIISIVAVLAWIGLLIWGAIEDGRSGTATRRGPSTADGKIRRRRRVH